MKFTIEPPQNEKLTISECQRVGHVYSWDNNSGYYLCCQNKAGDFCFLGLGSDAVYNPSDFCESRLLRYVGEARMVIENFIDK